MVKTGNKKGRKEVIIKGRKVRKGRAGRRQEGK
jgi:hypothetical protein